MPAYARLGRAGSADPIYARVKIGAMKWCLRDTKIGAGSEQVVLNGGPRQAVAETVSVWLRNLGGTPLAFYRRADRKPQRQLEFRTTRHRRERRALRSLSFGFCASVWNKQSFYVNTAASCSAQGTSAVMAQFLIITVGQPSRATGK